MDENPQSIVIPILRAEEARIQELLRQFGVTALTPMHRSAALTILRAMDAYGTSPFGPSPPRH